jgi:deoxyribose-phosphate aldolase
MSVSIARCIDHSLLNPTLTDAELRAGCELARRLGTASVCIKPYAVRLCAEILAGSNVAVSTVIGFPQGSNTTEVKVFEADQACRDGAKELDMVVNIGKVLSGDWEYVEADIRAVVDTAHRYGAITKVIFENDFLPSDDLKIRLCDICRRVGAEFVKTSTGFGFVKQANSDYNYRGATEHDVKLMKAHAGPQMLVKAAGGVRNYADTVRMCEIGCSRIGASATEAIVAGEKGAPAAEVLKAATQGY